MLNYLVAGAAGFTGAGAVLASAVFPLQHDLLSCEHVFPVASFLQHAFSSFFFLSSPFLSSPHTVVTEVFENKVRDDAEVAPTIPVKATSKNNFFHECMVFKVNTEFLNAH